MTARREAVRPPLYDLPFDLTATTETPAPVELPPPESSAFPELPPAAPEGAMVLAESPVHAEPSAPLELPAPETPMETTPVEPVAKPARRRPRPEPEIPPAETKEDAWTPAYRDAPETRPHGTASKTTTDKAPDTPQKSGEPPKVRNKDASPARKADRTVRTPADRDSAPIGERQAVKEKGGVASEQQPQATELGRQKLIQERGREAKALPTAAGVSETNIPETNPPLTETHFPENRSVYTRTDSLPKSVTEHPVPQTREQPSVRTNGTEPRQAGPKQKEMLAERADVSSDRMVVRTRDAETQSNGVTPGQTVGQQSAGTAEQVKRELIRERSQQTAVRQSDTVSNFGSPLPAHDSTTPETPVQTTQKPPETRRVGTQTAEESVYHSALFDAGTPPQDAVSGRQNVIRERMKQSAIRQKNTGVGVRDSAATHVGETAEASTPNPPKTPKTNRVAAQTAEAAEYHPAPSNAGTTPQNAVLGKQKAIRERAEKIAEKPTSVGRGFGLQIKSKPASIGGEVAVDATQQNRMSVKTREAYGQRETPSSVGDTYQTPDQRTQTAIRKRAEKIADKPASTDRPAVQDGQKIVRERVETVRENLSPVTLQESGEYASKTLHEDWTPVKTREAYVQREAPTEAEKTSMPTIQERQKAIRESMDGRTSSVAETSPKGEGLHPQTKPATGRPGPDIQTLVPKQERIPVKTREAYVQRTAPRMVDSSRTAEQGKTDPASVRVRTESGQVSIKTKGVCLQRQTPATVTETTAPQTGGAASREAPKELRKTVRTREGLIQSPEPSAEAISPQPDTPDRKLPAHERSGHAVEVSSPQTQPTPPAQETALSAGTGQRVPDIKTRSAYARREAAQSHEQPDHAVEQGRQKFVREQKRKADLKRAAERCPKTREAQLPEEEAETASEEAKNLAIERARQTQTVRTKEAWLRQQGLDGPKERTAPELRGGGTPIYQKPGRQTAGSLPLKSEDGLPGTESLSSVKGADGRKFLPALPRGESGSIKARTTPARFIREKRRSTGGAAGNAAGKTVRDAAVGGSKAIKTMRPVVVKEAGRAAGKTIKTAETASKKAAKTAGTASAQMMKNAKRAAQASAKAKVVKEATVRAAKQGARTLKEAAKAVAAGAKAAAASLQSLIAGLSAGGGVVLVILVVICLIGLLVATPFGLFLSGQTGVGDDNIQAAVSRLTGEYNARLQEIQEDISHDELDMASNIVSAMTGN